MSAGNEPLRKTMCATCPFRPGSPYAYLAPDLTISAMENASRICHSTGSKNAINNRTGLAPHLCRGARDVQLAFMAAMGVIEAATDKAWNTQRVAIGLPRTKIKNP
jgi:hypothetical protein